MELLPNLSITIQSRKNGKGLFEKIIIPYSSNFLQIYCSLDLAARRVSNYIFEGNKERYLADKRRRKWNQSDAKTENKEIFDFVHKNKYELQLIFALPDILRKAKESGSQEPRLT